MRVDIPGSRFGTLPGLPVGTRWADRQAMSEDHMHPPLVAGIYGRKADGARSVVLAGHYDDEDNGDTFTYIGTGGREPGVRFGPQTRNQDFENPMNQALSMSAKLQKPVRVIRGHTLRSRYAPYEGFRYDGLYRVHNPRLEEGPNGLMVCKFDFRRIPDQPPLPELELPPVNPTDIEMRRSLHRKARKKRDGTTSHAADARPITAKWEGKGAGPSSRPRTNTAPVPSTSTARRSEEPGEVGEARSDDTFSFGGRFTSPITATSAPVGSEAVGSEDVDDVNPEDLGLESDDEDQEDAFAAIDKVEREFQPVQSKLQQLSERGTGGPQQKQRRRDILADIGDHVDGILRRKRQLRDERYDEKWWERELCEYVSTFLPTDEIMKPENVRRLFDKYRRRTGRNGHGHGHARGAVERTKRRA